MASFTWYQSVSSVDEIGENMREVGRPDEESVIIVHVIGKAVPDGENVFLDKAAVAARFPSLGGTRSVETATGTVDVPRLSHAWC